MIPMPVAFNFRHNLPHVKYVLLDGCGLVKIDHSCLAGRLGNGVTKQSVMTVCKIEQTEYRRNDYLCSRKQEVPVEITNRLACWLLERYFERVMAFLQRHPAHVPLQPSLPAHDKAIR
jgi:hypothetical protein